MKSAMVIMVLALFLRINAVNGQIPYLCNCFRATDIPRFSRCDAFGCSIGTNPNCFNGKFDVNAAYGVLSFNNYFDGSNNANFELDGCNCPGSPSNATHNGSYSPIANFDIPYNYNTCTAFGSNARDSTTGQVFAYAVNATDCCNFCCNRTDPYPNITTTTAVTKITTTTIPTTTTTTTVIIASSTAVITAATTTSSGQKIILDILLYLNSVVILGLIVLKIN